MRRNKTIISTLIILIAFVSGNISAQETEDYSEYYKYEVTIISGYHSTLGFIGAKFGVRPLFLKRKIQFNAGFGFSIIQSLNISLGTNFYPLKERNINPYIGVDYGLGLPEYFYKDDGSYGYKIGTHNYINPYAALFIKIKDPLCLKIKAGYSFLQGSPKINTIKGTIPPDEYNALTKKIGSNFLVAIGISYSF